MAYSAAQELDRLSGALAAELRNLESLISNGMSRKLTPALMLELVRAKKHVKNGIDSLNLVLQGIS